MLLIINISFSLGIFVTSVTRQSVSIAALLFGLITVLSGCTPLLSEQREPQVFDGADNYHSTLVDPQAKALFAFSQFRMFGSTERWEDAVEALQRAIVFDPESNYLRLVLARTYLHTEQLNESIQVLTLLVARASDYAPGYELLGDIYSFQGDYEQAIKHFRRALELSPEDTAAVRMRLGAVLERSGDSGGAIDLFESLLNDSSYSTAARLSLARIYQYTGQTDKATVAYQMVLNQIPGHPLATLGYGNILNEDDPQAALTLYLVALKYNPLAAALHQRVAEHYLAHQELESALEHFQLVLSQFPDNLQLASKVALIDLELKHWVAAETGFRRLLVAPDPVDHYRYYLAVALTGQGRFGEAIDELEKITPESPNYASAALQLSYLYSQVERREDAIRILEQMLDHDLHYEEVYYYLATFFNDQGQYREALNLVKNGLIQYPDNVRLLYQLGVVYEHLDDSPAAVRIMEQILTLDNDYADALNFLAYYQAEEGLDLDLALERGLRAHELKPSPYIADTLGWIYFKMGHYERSRRHLEAAAEGYPNDSVIQEHLGDLYRAMQLWQESENAYQRALTLDPDAVHIKQKIDQLKKETPQ